MVQAAEGDDADAERRFCESIAAAKGYRALAIDATVEYAKFLLGRRRSAEARPLLERTRAFFVHPMVSKRRQEIEELLRRCDEVPAT